MTAYQKLILEYAKVLQLYSSSGPLIFKFLEAKRTAYSEDPKTKEKYNFWAQVTDVFVGNSQKILFDVFRGEEIGAKKDPDKIREIAYLKIKKHTNATLWFTMIPDIKQYVYQILKNRRDFETMRNGVRYKTDPEERHKMQKELAPSLFATKCALYPCMNGYRIKKEKTQFFKYIPLLIWSLENLFYYGRYAPECDPFIQKVVIHVLRLHKQYADEMLMLMQREDEMYTSSKLFGGEQSFNPGTELKEDAEYCDFSMQLQTNINMKEYTLLNNPAVKSIKRTNLLFSVYRIEKLVDLYNVPGYFHTINNSDLERALNSVNHLSQTYSVCNIKAILTNRIYSLATSPDFYDREIFEETYSEVMLALENLMHINILSTSDTIEVKKEIDKPVSLRKEILARG